MKTEHRERATFEVQSRVVERHMRAASSGGVSHLENLINDTLYHERRRLDRAPRDALSREQSRFYRDAAHRLAHESERGLRELLEQLTLRFVEEIVGNFDERVYRLSTSVIPAGLSLMLNAASPGRLGKLGDLEALSRSVRDHILIEGDVEQLTSLQERGTLMVVPTHTSHLDSILLGYAAHLVGLPPLLYGAGLNLFTNPLISFFMNNLGAYRVDRKKTAGLYKEVLKEYATVALEHGYDNLFFPGGTRSRTGAVESKLKRGLLGTAVSAYVNNLQSGNKKPNIYIVPCTISYKLVLEAETLIDDHLKEAGKSRYIIEDDEFSRPRRILNFFNELVTLDSRIVIRFSPASDIVGNPVDTQGRSFDPRGRMIDCRSYVSRNGEPYHDAQRDREYTNEISTAITTAFHDDNVVMSTNVVGHALTTLLRKENPTLDRFRLLRTGGTLPSFSASEVTGAVGQLLETLRDMDNGPRLSGDLSSSDPGQVLDDALTHFGIYHALPAAVRRGDRIFHEDRNLLLYYGNRLQGYDLDRRMASSNRASRAPEVTS